MVTLTATDATTVTVTATDGTTTSDPVSIAFQRAPYLMASETLALVYEGSSATVTVTAMHFPAVMFVPSIKNSEGEMRITQEGNVYTLTSNGAGNSDGDSHRCYQPRYLRYHRDNVPKCAQADD